MARSEKRTEFLSDIMLTAVGGGIQYWAYVIDYSEDGMTTIVADQEDFWDDENTEQYTVTLDSLAKAMKLIEKNEELSSKWMRKLIIAANRQNDCGPDFTPDEDAPRGYSDIDALVADFIFQIAAFGKVVYG